ncbi:hypothetical protein [Bifidobacterium adolescentis]|uniref:hypothetical protein n=1 Tax=Bifidobacterium adolescentis TaxID=1680 RepID=UPI0034A474D1
MVKTDAPAHSAMTMALSTVQARKPPLDCRFIGLLLDVRIGVQGDARVAALLVAHLIILSVRCETSLSALSDQSMFRIEEKSAKLTFVKYDSACAKRYQYRRVA